MTNGFDLGNFDRQAKASAQKVVGQATEAIRSIAQQFYSDLVERAADRGEPGGSPVASGRYAASMRLDLNRIDTSTAPRDPSYRYPAPEVHKYSVRNLPPRTRANVNAAAIAAKLRLFKLGDTIWISNSTPYARRIERDAHSWQTPQGVFEVTARQIVKKFKFAKLRVFNG